MVGGPLCPRKRYRGGTNDESVGRSVTSPASTTWSWPTGRSRNPGPGQVVVEVRACSLNARDSQVIRGFFDLGHDGVTDTPSPTARGRSSLSARA